MGNDQGSAGGPPLVARPDEMSESGHAFHQQGLSRQWRWRLVLDQLIVIKQLFLDLGSDRVLDGLTLRRRHGSKVILGQSHLFQDGVTHVLRGRFL